MSAIREFTRFDLLLSQFSDRDSTINQKKSLDRLFHYIYENTDIYYLTFIREEILVQYLKYHRSHQFKIISFTQAIEDIKYFTFFLNNKIKINKEFQLDLSLKNTKLWLNL